MKVYVPVSAINDYSCYVIYDPNTIRAYLDSPHLGDNAYTDFYISSHYLEKNGVQNISSSIEFPQCENINRFTNDYWYRLDLAHIIVIVSFILLILYFTYRVFARMFGRWLKI